MLFVTYSKSKAITFIYLIFRTKRLSLLFVSKFESDTNTLLFNKMEVLQSKYKSHSCSMKDCIWSLIRWIFLQCAFSTVVRSWTCSSSLTKTSSVDLFSLLLRTTIFLEIEIQSGVKGLPSQGHNPSLNERFCHQKVIQ